MNSATSRADTVSSTQAGSVANSTHFLHSDLDRILILNSRHPVTYDSDADSLSWHDSTPVSEAVKRTLAESVGAAVQEFLKRQHKPASFTLDSFRIAGKSRFTFKSSGPIAAVGLEFDLLPALRDSAGSYFLIDVEGRHQQSDNELAVLRIEQLSRDFVGFRETIKALKLASKAYALTDSRFHMTSCAYETATMIVAETQKEKWWRETTFTTIFRAALALIRDRLVQGVALPAPNDPSSNVLVDVDRDALLAFIQKWMAVEEADLLHGLEGAFHQLLQPSTAITSLVPTSVVVSTTMASFASSSLSTPPSLSSSLLLPSASFRLSSDMQLALLSQTGAIIHGTSPAPTSSQDTITAQSVPRQPEVAVWRDLMLFLCTVDQSVRRSRNPAIAWLWPDSTVISENNTFFLTNKAGCMALVETVIRIAETFGFGTARLESTGNAWFNIEVGIRNLISSSTIISVNDASAITILPRFRAAFDPARRGSFLAKYHQLLREIDKHSARDHHGYDPLTYYYSFGGDLEDLIEVKAFLTQPAISASWNNTGELEELVSLACPKIDQCHSEMRRWISTLLHQSRIVKHYTSATPRKSRKAAASHESSASFRPKQQQETVSSANVFWLSQLTVPVYDFLGGSVRLEHNHIIDIPGHSRLYKARLTHSGQNLEVIYKEILLTSQFLAMHPKDQEDVDAEYEENLGYMKSEMEFFWLRNGHPAGIGLRGACFNPPAVLMEGCNRGTLQNVLWCRQPPSFTFASREPSLSFLNKVCCCHQIVTGLHFLNNHDVLSPFFTSADVFVQQQPDDVFSFKLSCQYQTAFSRRDQESRFVSQSVLDAQPAPNDFQEMQRWRAPEFRLPNEELCVVVGDIPESKKAETGAVYCLGLLIGEVMTGLPPFEKYMSVQSLQRALDHQVHPFEENALSTISQALAAFIRLCTYWDPIRRPSLFQIFTHLWPEVLHSFEFPSNHPGKLSELLAVDSSYKIWGGYSLDSSAKAQFINPRSMCMYPKEKLILVLDTDNNRVQIYTRFGDFRRKWGEKGDKPGHFHTPFGIGAAANGNIYVVDTFNHRIQVMDITGNHIRSWGKRGSSTGEFVYPYAVAVSDRHGLIYIADSDNHRVQVFDFTGVYKRSLGSGEVGSNPGQLTDPRGVALWNDPSDEKGEDVIYVTDWENNCVQKFAMNGRFLKKWGQGSEECHLYNPMGISISADGFVFVADSYNHRIQQFDLEGGQITHWGGKGHRYGQFYVPEGVFASPIDETVYVLDTRNCRIQVFDRNNIDRLSSLNDKCRDDNPE